MKAFKIAHANVKETVQNAVAKSDEKAELNKAVAQAKVRLGMHSFD